MLLQLRTVYLMATLIVTYGFPAEKYSDSDIDEISTKLVKLKSLLEKLDVRRKSENAMEESPKYVKEPIKSDIAAPREDNVYNDVNDDSSSTQKMMNMKKFIDSLNEEELNKLRMLRTLADSDIMYRSTADTNKDVSSKEMVTDNKQQYSINQLNDVLQEEKKPGNIPAVTGKGKFLPSKDEIKYAVEKNLLTDVALAMHSGISVNDLLKDLIGQTAGSKLDAAKEQGEWIDKPE